MSVAARGQLFVGDLKMLFSETVPQQYTLADIKAFGSQLIKTEDLDPVYCAVHRAKLSTAQLKRLLLSYCCFYALGAAANLSEYEGKDFWRWMIYAAQNDGKWAAPTENGRWPRGAERRHFRGDKCVAAIIFLSSEGTPETLVDSIIEPVGDSNTLTLERVMERTMEWPLFGPWIAFKVADMVERLLGVAVEFPIDLTTIYKEPRAALGLVPGDPLDNTKALIDFFAASYTAPPLDDRPCNVQEVETVLCKWKSSTTGHYWVGKDIKEVRHGLEGWGETAAKLLAAAPKEV